MRSAQLFATCLTLLTAGACGATRNPPPSQPSSVARSGPSPAATLGIPPGHLPPVGQCRVWVPKTPPGHQAPPRSCQGIERAAPAGSWILYRPPGDKKVVHLRVVDERRPAVVRAVWVYDAKRGVLLREE